MKVSQKEIYNYLISKGLSRNHALGMLANIKAESNFDAGLSGGSFSNATSLKEKFSIKDFISPQALL